MQRFLISQSLESKMITFYVSNFITSHMTVSYALISNQEKIYNVDASTRCTHLIVKWQYLKKNDFF